MRGLGGKRQASAWAAWARPISAPQGVAALLFDMFWALNGATRNPRFARSRQRAVATQLLPLLEELPRTAMTLAGLRVGGEGNETGLG